MRRLLYVPIIHDEADLGSVGSALAQRSAHLMGKGRWLLHKETACRFWSSVASHLRAFDPAQLKVYQDGLAADGEATRRIVAEAARRGSKNYQLVLDLIDRGAELRKTEDPVLLLHERDNLLGEMRPGPAQVRQRNAGQYRLQRNRLMEARDKFIAEAISASLKETEIGVLFMGAYHDVVSLLPEDISIEAVKQLSQVRAYFEELFAGHDDRFKKLAQGLAAPITSATRSPGGSETGC